MGFRNPVQTIAGPVDIGTIANPVTVASIGDPVNVQGGGEQLFSSLVTLDTDLGGLAWIAEVVINPPPSGLTYYGLRVSLEFADVSRYSYVVGDVIGSAVKATPAADVYQYGAHAHQFVVPFTRAYPVVVQVLAPPSSGGTAQCLVTVEGISVATVGPITNPAYSRRHAGGTGTFLLAAGKTSILWLPPSFQDYEVHLAPTSGGSVTATSMSIVLNESSTPSFMTNPHVSPYYSTGSPTMAYPNVAKVPIRGDGRAKYLAVAVAGNTCWATVMV